MAKIEVEYRSICSEEDYNRIMNFLLENGEDLGEDDKDSSFYILDKKLLKVVKNISKNSAKISLKLQEVGDGSGQEEFEYEIPIESVETAKEVFKHLGFTERIDSYQKRHNFIYKGIEFAVKYSKDWSYHIEMEILIDSEDERAEAERKIEDVAKELGIKLMTDEEQKKLVEEIRSKNSSS
ncbi:MAG TPA: CYTH domain-containing protein [Candidatus Dojkabacteria bacterium]|nr:CYTH domain-containing protein [Candidatus Dojkabacteria bacterium]